jgi:hypothetical protein
MFYLVEFFKSLSELFIRGILFFIFTCVLSFTLSHRSVISKMIEKVSPEKLVNPYFVVVLDGNTDVQKFQELIQVLPGVLKIDEKESEASKQRVMNLIKELGPDYKIGEDQINFKSVRIILSSSLSQESLEFVRDQVVKMSKDQKITATPIKYPEVTKVLNTHPFYYYLKKIGDWGIVGFFSLLWIASYWLCYDIFRSRAYLLEKFQRRKYVAAKSLAMGLGLVFILFTILSILNGVFKLFDLVILFMILSVFWTFSMQDWKWKNTV